MTVIDLINELKKFPQDIEIFIDYNCDLFELNDVYLYDHPVISYDSYKNRDSVILLSHYV